MTYRNFGLKRLSPIDSLSYALQQYETMRLVATRSLWRHRKLRNAAETAADLSNGVTRVAEVFSETLGEPPSTMSFFTIYHLPNHTTASSYSFVQKQVYSTIYAPSAIPCSFS
jgi:hypothetical protein